MAQQDLRTRVAVLLVLMPLYAIVPSATASEPTQSSKAATILAANPNLAAVLALHPSAIAATLDSTSTPPTALVPARNVVRPARGCSARADEPKSPPGAQAPASPPPPTPATRPRRLLFDLTKSLTTRPKLPKSDGQLTKVAPAAAALTAAELASHKSARTGPYAPDCPLPSTK